MNMFDNPELTGGIRQSYGEGENKLHVLELKRSARSYVGKYYFQKNIELVDIVEIDLFNNSGKQVSIIGETNLVRDILEKLK